MTTILLARHGETEWNRDGRYQGWADPPLNAAGFAQARTLADQLRSTPFDAVYSSDLRRAQETAEIVAGPHGVPVIVDPGLREVNVGAWSGLTRAEVERRFPDGERPGGETREQHAGRVLAAAERIARAHPDRGSCSSHTAGRCGPSGCTSATSRFIRSQIVGFSSSTSATIASRRRSGSHAGFRGPGAASRPHREHTTNSRSRRRRAREPKSP